MSERLTIQCWEPAQARKAFIEQVWPVLKSMLMAGHRMVLTLTPETRSIEQNRRMWAMLGEIAAQVDWYGQKLSADDWKHVLSASLRKQRAVPGIDGGFVVLGLSTSKMSKGEMVELQELIEAFGVEHSVKFSAIGYE